MNRSAFAGIAVAGALLAAAVAPAAVPWGFPCVRVEGGAYTGKGSPADSCEVGVRA